MSILIGFLTVLLVLASLLLGLLVLIQLPKKEAGMGAAFGGGTTDALFGAGSGTALTHITKYTAATFLGLCLILSVLHSRQSSSGSRNVLEKLEQKSKTTAVVPSAAAPATATAGTNALTLPSATTPAPAAPALTTPAAAVAPATAPTPVPPPATAPAPNK
ncbi:MAG: preprotein translocase subunit SecG [Verrucomicrobia bacterium]|nr:preprotein translocase subunit SecG [Verrucomicrobiota bacterium]